MRYHVSGEYPMMANWLIVKKTGTKGQFIIKNILVDVYFEIDKQSLSFLRHLDGNTNPYELGEKYDVDVETLMEWFSDNMLIRTEGRKWLSSDGMTLTTWYVPEKRRTKSIIPKVYNFLLLIGWLPILCCGIYQLLNAYYDFHSEYMVLSYFLSLGVGIVFHEISHAMACLAHGGYFLEMGSMWYYVFPGAYVLIDKSNIKSKLKRINVDIAGVLSNIFLAGLFLSLIPCFENLSGCFTIVAFNNILLAVFNLTFISGLDGCSVMEEVLGIEDGMEQIKQILRDGLRIEKWDKMSVNKVAETVVSGFLLLYQILMPIVVINFIMSIVGGVIGP